jgi:hypothetical protein
VLISLLFTVSIATYVKYAYKVDYLESYKNSGHLKQGRPIRFPSMMVTQINLRDAYRYSGSYESARMIHQSIIDEVEKKGAPDVRYIGGEYANV